MNDGRQQVHSGVYRAYGRKVNQSTGSTLVDGSLTLFCAFEGADFQRFRFDRSQPERIIHPADKLSLDKLPVEVRETKLILDKGCAYSYKYIYDSLYIINSDQN